jgi:hypothetical protein
MNYSITIAAAALLLSAAAFAAIATPDTASAEDLKVSGYLRAFRIMVDGKPGMRHAHPEQ